MCLIICQLKVFQITFNSVDDWHMSPSTRQYLCCFYCIGNISGKLPNISNWQRSAKVLKVAMHMLDIYIIKQKQWYSCSQTFCKRAVVPVFEPCRIYYKNRMMHWLFILRNLPHILSASISNKIWDINTKLFL